MQAIITHRRRSTNGNTYIFAKCEAGSLRHETDGGFVSEADHVAAATALANKFGWLEPTTGEKFSLVSGSLNGGESYAHNLMPASEYRYVNAYCIQARIVEIHKTGKTSHGVPTFYLLPDVQGITSVDGANRVASNILRKAMEPKPGSNYEFHTNAVLVSLRENSNDYV